MDSKTTNIIGFSREDLMVDEISLNQSVHARVHELLKEPHEDNVIQAPPAEDTFTTNSGAKSPPKKGFLSSLWRASKSMRLYTLNKIVRPLFGEEGHRFASTLDKSATSFINADEGEGLEEAWEPIAEEYKDEIDTAHKLIEEYNPVPPLTFFSGENPLTLSYETYLNQQYAPTQWFEPMQFHSQPIEKKDPVYTQAEPVRNESKKANKVIEKVVSVVEQVAEWFPETPASQPLYSSYHFSSATTPTPKSPIAIVEEVELVADVLEPVILLATNVQNQVEGEVDYIAEVVEEQITHKFEAEEVYSFEQTTIEEPVEELVYAVAAKEVSEEEEKVESVVVNQVDKSECENYVKPQLVLNKSLPLDSIDDEVLEQPLTYTPQNVQTVAVVDAKQLPIQKSRFVVYQGGVKETGSESVRYADNIATTPLRVDNTISDYPEVSFAELYSFFIAPQHNEVVALPPLPQNLVFIHSGMLLLATQNRQGKLTEAVERGLIDQSAQRVFYRVGSKSNASQGDSQHGKGDQELLIARENVKKKPNIKQSVSSNKSARYPVDIYLS